MNFASKTKQSGNKYVARVVNWLEEVIVDLKSASASADESISTMAMEVQCGEPGCVPIETMIVLLSAFTLPNGKSWRWTGKVLKPISEVTQDDIRALPLPATICEDTASGVNKINGIEASSDILSLASATMTSTSVLESPSGSTIESSAAVEPGVKATGAIKLASKSSFASGFVDESDRRETLKEKHKAGVRARGCPCCDPDNLDNVLDSLMFNPI